MKFSDAEKEQIKRDLVERLRIDAPLNTADRSTFYGGDERGYLDYPTMEQVHS